MKISSKVERVDKSSYFSKNEEMWKFKPLFPDFGQDTVTPNKLEMERCVTPLTPFLKQDPLYTFFRPSPIITKSITIFDPLHIKHQKKGMRVKTIKNESQLKSPINKLDSGLKNEPKLYLHRFKKDPINFPCKSTSYALFENGKLIKYVLNDKVFDLTKYLIRENIHDFSQNTFK